MVLRVTATFDGKPIKIGRVNLPALGQERRLREYECDDGQIQVLVGTYHIVTVDRWRTGEISLDWPMPVPCVIEEYRREGMRRFTGTAYLTEYDQEVPSEDRAENIRETFTVSVASVEWIVS